MMAFGASLLFLFFELIDLMKSFDFSCSLLKKDFDFRDFVAEFGSMSLFEFTLVRIRN